MRDTMSNLANTVATVTGSGVAVLSTNQWLTVAGLLIGVYGAVMGTLRYRLELRREKVASEARLVRLEQKLSNHSEKNENIRGVK